MAGCYALVKNGDGVSPHMLEDTETKKKVFLCSCGCTDNENGRCDGTHNQKIEHGCCGKGKAQGQCSCC
jgi:CDGSH-type Zn-finger protein